MSARGREYGLFLERQPLQRSRRTLGRSSGSTTWFSIHVDVDLLEQLHIAGNGARLLHDERDGPEREDERRSPARNP